MGWVVTSWRTDALERAAREVADADAYLHALEELGLETRERVREQRHVMLPVGPAPPAGVARLRQSPLAELFRATAAR
jgi:hypothetical protein